MDSKKFAFETAEKLIKSSIKFTKVNVWHRIIIIISKSIITELQVMRRYTVKTGLRKV